MVGPLAGKRRFANQEFFSWFPMPITPPLPRTSLPYCADITLRGAVTRNPAMRNPIGEIEATSGKTLSEKILSAKSGRDVRAGDVVICEVDCALGTDGSIPMAVDYLDAMGGGRVNAPQRLVFALDHYAPAPSPKAALLQAGIRRFAKEQ